MINEKGKELFTEYDKVEAIENFDSKQNIWYEENLLRVMKNGKYGVIDYDGNKLIVDQGYVYFQSDLVESAEDKYKSF